MAGLGFKDFQVGEVLTSSDVDGYLMQQSVMRFADAGARGSALGTAVGTGVALAEGMVTYLDDTNAIEVYNGTAWTGVGGFNAGTAITATDASWTVPTLANAIIRVTVVGGGGGGGGGTSSGPAGSAGGASSFASSAGTATASGGLGGRYGGATNTGGPDGTDGLASGNGGQSGHAQSSGVWYDGGNGGGGQVVVAYYDMTGITTANVTVGAGGAGGGTLADRKGGDGGDGVVIVEYRAV